jgi:hypothetical protein
MRKVVINAGVPKTTNPPRMRAVGDEGAENGTPPVEQHRKSSADRRRKQKFNGSFITSYAGLLSTANWTILSG